jgi:hypothetical protein
MKIRIPAPPAPPPPTPPRSRRPVPPPRDQEPSTFSRILERLLHATPGGQAAALVDFEGETVDYAGHLDPFELKVTAAHWLIALSEIAADTSRVGTVARLTVRARGRGYYVRRLEENYALVLILHPRAAFAVSERAIHEAIVSLSAEAGWPVPRDAARWFCVEVQSERQGRLVRPRSLKVAGRFQPVEIMGAVVGLAPRERGFRVRLPTGAEMMLVRERLGRWFADEHVE